MNLLRLRRPARPDLTAAPRSRLWDLPTRLFHWVLVALILFQWISSSFDDLRPHFISGETILALLLFRLCWGFFGSANARFSDFVAGPRAALAHFGELWGALRRRGPASHPDRPGHTPLGGWMVMALILLLLVQVGTGLFSSDGNGNDGPFYHLISDKAADMVSAIHPINFDLILALVAVHILAAFFYLWRFRDNRIWPMIVGWRGGAVLATTGKFASARLALALFAVVALLVFALVHFFGG